MSGSVLALGHSLSLRGALMRLFADMRLRAAQARLASSSLSIGVHEGWAVVFPMVVRSRGLSLSHSGVPPG